MRQNSSRHSEACRTAQVKSETTGCETDTSDRAPVQRTKTTLKVSHNLITANHKSALRTINSSKSTLFRSSWALQTSPNMPASAPAASNHSGFHGLSRTTVTVRSVIEYPRQSWLTARISIVALANISPIVIGARPRRIARPSGALG
jgi:hypothetical protein